MANEGLQHIQSQINACQARLNNLDADFKILQECKEDLAKCSVYFDDLITQCDDIKKTFDRATIEGRYDSYQITFKNKNLVFDYLDNIVSSTDKFRGECEDIKGKIDNNYNLDNECIDLANETQEVYNNLMRLKTVYYNTKTRM